MYKTKYPGMESIFVYYRLYRTFITKETNYAEIKISEY